jgi:hypothetical protein
MILGKYGKFGFINEPMAVYRQTGVGVSSKHIHSRDYQFIHNTNWIKIWELGLIDHEYKYTKEAVATILFFYTNIINQAGLTKKLHFKLNHLILIQSELRPRLRIVVFTKFNAFLVKKIMKSLINKGISIIIRK